MTNLLNSELRKVITLRFWWALIIAPLAVGMFSSAIYAALASDFGDSDFDELSTGVASFGLYVAMGWVILFAAIFGAINAGTEYRHKTLTTTFLTTAGRDRVIAAKFLVTAAFALAYGFVVQFTSIVCLLIFGGNAFHVNADLFGVLATGLYATVCWSLIGAGLGLLLGSSIGAALAVVSWYLVGELTVAAIAAGIGIDRVGSVLPGFTTIATVGVGSLDSSDWFVPWPLAPVLLLLWAAVFAGPGWWLTRTRDIT